jgi:hypothetical protein
MRTLGVDLASQPKKTAICEIVWRDGTATVSTVKVGVTDPEIVAFARGLNLPKHDDSAGNAIGIDAPFGWPQPFVEFVSRPMTGIRDVPAFDPVAAQRLCFRLTDDHVRTELGMVPLAVAADRIARSAMRCSGLLDDLGVVDRSGVDGVYEVYPAAALKAWGFPYAGYKSPKANDPIAKGKLSALFQLVCQACPWLSFAEMADYDRCLTNDDAFDALIASFAARAAALGLTISPTTPEEIERAKVEGWIAIPPKDSSVGTLP